MTVGNEGLCQFGILLQAANYGENADLDIEAAKNAKQPPAPDPRAILKTDSTMGLRVFG